MNRWTGIRTMKATDRLTAMVGLRVRGTEPQTAWTAVGSAMHRPALIPSNSRPVFCLLVRPTVVVALASDPTQLV